MNQQKGNVRDLVGSTVPAQALPEPPAYVGDDGVHGEVVVLPQHELEVAMPDPDAVDHALAVEAATCQVGRESAAGFVPAWVAALGR